MPESSSITDLTRGVYRRIYAGFLHGKRINRVSTEAECCFWRLHALADDFGNLRANPDNLRAEAFPKRRVTAREVEGWIGELAAADLITPYSVDDDPFVHINGFVELQTASSKNGKRTRRVPEWAGDGAPGESGESKNSQGNPKASSPHHSDSHSENQHQHQHHNGAGGAAGGFALTPEEEAAAQALVKKPEWVKDGQGWFDLAAARELVALRLPAQSYTTAIRIAKGRRTNLTNPAGWIKSELRKAASQNGAHP